MINKLADSENISPFLIHILQDSTVHLLSSEICNLPVCLALTEAKRNFRLIRVNK